MRAWRMPELEYLLVSLLFDLALSLDGIAPHR
jgi:hypothetical protein